ncbi:MAG: class II aldolase/adducin family protein [Spirochaetaceae bacterium]|jgi:ribulose-5-phosphate 4-epimerase/fuculose-1-phosphate aldolase|nr:class II aldolase/adducin family protein [Spirochaetaceae bacterium]
MDEGYVKYHAEHRFAQAEEPPHWAELQEARTRLHDLGLIGVDPGGVGYGNVSLRLEAESGNSVSNEKFYISGTATGGMRVLSASGYCRVLSFDIEKNYVESAGPVQASSESMTHGAIYRAKPAVNSVIHIHSKAIFEGMLSGGYPSTPPESAYGTPEMAHAIAECVKFAGKNSGKNAGVIVMAGHDAGVIAYGASVEEALSLTLELYRAFVGDDGSGRAH